MGIPAYTEFGQVRLFPFRGRRTYVYRCLIRNNGSCSRTRNHRSEISIAACPRTSRCPGTRSHFGAEVRHQDEGGPTLKWIGRCKALGPYFFEVAARHRGTAYRDYEMDRTLGGSIRTSEREGSSKDFGNQQAAGLQDGRQRNSLCAL